MQPPTVEDRAIEALIEDVDFQDLRNRLSESTLFDVLGVSFEERRHSRMLAWLLNPSETHGLDDTLLRNFLRAAAKSARHGREICFEEDCHLMTPLEAETWTFSDLRIDPEYPLPSGRRPDIVLWSAREKWLCVIENKIFAGEGEAQTADYYKEMLSTFPVERFRSRLFVYLSPNRTQPESQHFLAMSYSVILDLLGGRSESASDLGRTAIDQYLKCLRGRIVDQEQRRDICWKLYRKHYLAIKTILDLGSVNRLANAIGKAVMQQLQSEENSIITGQADWKRRDWGHGIAIWPGHWQLGQAGWPIASYHISYQDPEGLEEKVKLGIQLEGKPVGLQRRQFIELATQRGLDGSMLLTRQELVSRGPDELDAVAQEGVRVLLAKVKSSYDLLNELVKNGDDAGNTN
jgi:hypothetical protein